MNKDIDKENNNINKKPNKVKEKNNNRSRKFYIIILLFIILLSVFVAIFIDDLYKFNNILNDFKSNEKNVDVEVVNLEQQNVECKVDTTDYDNKILYEINQLEQKLESLSNQISSIPSDKKIIIKDQIVKRKENIELQIFVRMLHNFYNGNSIANEFNELYNLNNENINKYLVLIKSYMNNKNISITFNEIKQKIQEEIEIINSKGGSYLLFKDLLEIKKINKNTINDVELLNNLMIHANNQDINSLILLLDENELLRNKFNKNYQELKHHNFMINIFNKISTNIE